MPPDDSLPPQIGRYTIARRLGAGGMGEVYLAYSPAGSPAAVKLIRRDRLDPLARARFVREAEIARTVVGTNRVARFLEADPQADRPWLAMEYVPGRTLAEYVSSQGRLPVALVASLGALLAEGLEAVHAVGLLHRDLKPQNVMLGAEGPMIIDFGLGAFIHASQDSLTGAGNMIGTVRCMPPEQASGVDEVTAAADVYALGTVLLFAASGHYPYEGPSIAVIAARVTSRDVAPDLTGVHPALVPLLEQMLAFEPEDRPSVAVVAQACAGLLEKAGANPADARLALIVRTVPGRGGAPSEYPSPSLEELMRAWRLGNDGESGSPPDDDAPAPDEPADLRSEPPPATAAAGDRPSRGTRVTASRRVAAELRERYAAQRAL